MSEVTISVVTPTLRRTEEIIGLLQNLAKQTVRPTELILVDGAPESESDTEQAFNEHQHSVPFMCHYVRHGGGTAIQRNVGVERARGRFIAFVDDDIRLEPDFFEVILEEFSKDTERRVGGITGNVANEFLDPKKSRRWQWYRRFRLFTTYEPGRYDYDTGYPINRKLQPPHNGVRQVDFFGTSCALWRSEVFAGGLRFSPFFADYGVLEDAHLALRAGREWELLECGEARCLHLRSNRSRVNQRRLAWKSAVNYRYVFIDIVPHRSYKQEIRFWWVQVFDLGRLTLYAMRNRRRDAWLGVVGKVEGIIAALQLDGHTLQSKR